MYFKVFVMADSLILRNHLDFSAEQTEMEVSFPISLTKVIYVIFPFLIKTTLCHCHYIVIVIKVKVIITRFFSSFARSSGVPN